MKRLLTTVLSLLAVSAMQAQGIRLSNGDVLNYNEVDSIVVTGKNRFYEASIGSMMKKENSISIFAEALEKTGLTEDMMLFEDYSWDYYDPKYENYHKKKIYTGAQWDMCDVPVKRLQKYTVFAVTDSLLQAKYGITSVAQLEAYAQKTIGGKDALRHLMAYHCLPFAAASYDRYVIITSIKYNITDRCVNPTSWYATMDEGHLVKMSRLMSAKDIRENGGVRDHIYLNRGDMETCHNTGVEISPDGAIESQNGWCFLADGLLAYDQSTREGVFNTNMRMNLIELCPEFHSNNMRNYQPWNTVSCEDIKAPAKNYILPNGYLKNFKVNEDGIFFYQGARSWYWSYQGDEFEVASDIGNEDLEITLPVLPEGTYQLRLGFCAMASRGIMEVSIDGKVTRSDFDMRSTNGFTDRIGWVSMQTLKSYDEERRNAILTNMHRKGWYHGPDDVFTTLYVHKDGGDALLSVSTGNLFCNQPGTLRAVLGKVVSNGSGEHTLRLKTSWAPQGCLLQVDYLEIVPMNLVDVDMDNPIEDEKQEFVTAERDDEQSVYYPAILRAEQDLSCYYTTLYKDGVTYNSNGEGLLGRINNWSTKHSVIIPTDNALQHYYDPVSYKRLRSNNKSDASAYVFKVNDKGFIDADAYRVDWNNLDEKGRGYIDLTQKVTSPAPVAETGSSRGSVFNHMKDIINSSWTETLFTPGRKFYTAKNGGPIVAQWNGNQLTGLAGSFQYERGYYVPVTETYDYTAKGNGKTYIIDEEPLQSTTLSPYMAITDENRSDFQAFASLLEGYGCYSQNDGNSHVTMDYALTNLSNNSYTIYVPKSNSVEALIAAHKLPTDEDRDRIANAVFGLWKYLDELESQVEWEMWDENNDTIFSVWEKYIEDRKAAETELAFILHEDTVMSKAMKNFISYHIQQTSVYVDGATLSNKAFPTMLSTDGKQNKLKVDYQSGGQMKVTDGSGKTHAVDATQNNILTRQYYFNGSNLKGTSCTEIYSSSFAVIHLIDSPLVASDEFLYNPETYKKVMEIVDKYYNEEDNNEEW